MNLEILETRLHKKKTEIELMFNDLKAITKASKIMLELGYDNTQLDEVAALIDADIQHFAREAVMLKNSYEKVKKEFEDTRKRNT
jgi:hypothetical protein